MQLSIKTLKSESLYFHYFAILNINNLFTRFFIDCSRFQQQGKTMNERSYVGIDKTDKDEWIAVVCNHGKFIFSRPYKNTRMELEALVRYISESYARPKICLNTANPSAFTLLEYIDGIPGVEVVLMSNAGLRLHLNWLPKEAATTEPLLNNNSSRACLLACCAERMI